MLWLKITVIVLIVAAVICGCYDFHLHLHNATRHEVILATLLTLFFGGLAGITGLMATKLSHKD